MRKQLVLTVVGSIMASVTLGQLNFTTSEMAPNMNKQDLHFAGAPIISGDQCNYMFHEDMNTLIVDCHNAEGMLIGHQVRIIQDPIKQCYTGNDVYMPTLKVNDLAKLYVKERSGAYVCCDYFEPGFGYLFTNCGGNEVVILNDRLNGTQSQQIRDQGFGANTTSLQGLQQAVWNWTELSELINAKCNNTYLAQAEYNLAGSWEMWANIDFPWQQWMNQSTTAMDLEGLKNNLQSYYDFLAKYLEQLVASGSSQAAQDQIIAILNEFPTQGFGNKTLNDIVTEYSPLIGNFTDWLKTVQLVTVNKLPALGSIKPGYRAIVAWVKANMVKEIYARMRQEIYGNATNAVV